MKLGLRTPRTPWSQAKTFPDTRCAPFTTACLEAEREVEKLLHLRHNIIAHAPQASIDQINLGNLISRQLWLGRQLEQSFFRLFSKPCAQDTEALAEAPALPWSCPFRATMLRACWPI